MQRIFPRLLLIFVFISFTAQLFSQQKYNRVIPDAERFSAGIVLGFNNAQMDGDFQMGFDKFGFTGGIKGIARITSRLDFNIEMLYSKKGSKIYSGNAAIRVNAKKDRIIDLTYVDAPIYFKWLLQDRANIWHVELGGVYSRLTDTKVTEVINDANREFSYQNVEQDFDKGDISTLVGFGHTWANGFALNLRYMFGLSKFYENQDFIPPNPNSINTRQVEFLRNYYYSFNLSYTIFKRQLKKKPSRRNR